MVPSTVYVRPSTDLYYVSQLPVFNNVFRNFTFISLKYGSNLHKSLKRPRDLMRSHYCYLPITIKTAYQFYAFLLFAHLSNVKIVTHRDNPYITSAYFCTFSDPPTMSALIQY